jgi:transposase
MSYCNLVCGQCGHHDDLMAFTTTPVFGDLPPGQFQCPVCSHAIKLQAAGALRILKSPDGGVFVFREKTEVVAIGARL